MSYEQKCVLIIGHDFAIFSFLFSFPAVCLTLKSGDPNKDFVNQNFQDYATCRQLMLLAVILLTKIYSEVYLLRKDIICLFIDNI